MAFALRPVWLLSILTLIMLISAPRDLVARQADQHEDGSVSTVTIRGEVTSSDDRPILGAIVYVFDDAGLQQEVVSDESGKFQIDLEPELNLKILVAANGKISQIRSLRTKSSTRIQIALQDQTKPLSGRIIDNQGMGVANAKLRVVSLRYKNQNLEIPADLKSIHFDSSTNKTGSFRFDGFEPSTFGQIRVSGNGFVDALLTSASFEDEIVLVVQPARGIKGKVVDQISKEPVSQVSVQAGGQQTVVNESGEFELTGIPAFQPAQVTATPIGKQPYLMKSERISVEQGFDPTEIEIKLQPGVWVNCNVKDFGNDGPAAAEVFYFPTPENQDFQSFVDSFLAGGSVPSSSTSSSGEAAIVAIPGPGAIAIVASGFPPNESINELTEEERAMLLGVTRRNDLTAVAWIDPEDLNDTVQLNFVVSKGRSIDVVLSDKRLDAKELVVVHRAASKTSLAQRVIGTSFVAQQFQPGETRQILVHAIDKRLGAVLNVNAEAEPPVQVSLEPTGSVLGRIVDKLGNPQSGLLVQFEAESSDGYQQVANSAFTDVNGRFEKPSLIASLEYRIAAVRNSNSEQMQSGAPMMDSRWYIAEKLKVNSNETVDLGKIELGSDKYPDPIRRPREEVVRGNNSLPSLISGVVTDQAGDPIADAEILFSTWPNRSDDAKRNVELKPKVLAQARSDSNGNFRMTIDSGLEEQLIAAETEEGNRNAAIIVVAQKNGVAQIPLRSISDPNNLSVQMVREMIVRGNVAMTAETGSAQLVPGPQMSIYDNDSIKKIIAGLQAGRSLASIRAEFQPISTVDPLAAGLPLAWELSSTGAFLIRNIPLNAMFELHAIGESGQRKTVMVISRPLRGFDIKPFDDSAEIIQLQGSRIKLNLDPLEVSKQ